MVYVIVRPLSARRTYCQPLLIEINTTLEFIPRYESDALFPLHYGAVAVRATQYKTLDGPNTENTESRQKTAIHR